jgi:hypothetical protein
MDHIIVESNIVWKVSSLSFGMRISWLVSQYLSQANKIKVITVIADKELSLTIELKDDTQETTTEAIGSATYSNSEAIVLSYASIFETLWIQSELQQHKKDNR